MTEGLGEVAERRAGGGIRLLGLQAQIVGAASGPLESGVGLVEVAAQGQHLGEPERAPTSRSVTRNEPRADSKVVSSTQVCPT